MAITGVLTADFSNFETAVKKAEASIKGMEGGAVKAEVALSNMSTRSVGPTNSLRESFGQVDQVLNASGVSVGKYARGLLEIGEMSGKTVGSIGLLATGASVFAAAMAGWQFGTWIAGITGLDKAVAKYADSLTNLPAEVAAAKQDVLSRATQIAKREITDYGEAQKIVATEMQRHIAGLQNWGAVLETAQQRVRELTAAEIADIEVMQRAQAPLADIIAKHDISALGLKLLAERQKQASKDADEHTKSIEKLAKAHEALIKNFDDARSNAMKKMHAQEAADMEATMQRRIANEEGVRRMEAEAHQMQMAELDQRTAAESAYESTRIAQNQAEIDAVLAAGAAHQNAGALAKAGTDQTVAGYAAVAQQITITGEAVKEWLNLMRYTAQANAILSENSLYTSTSQKQRIAGLGAFGAGGGTVNHNTFNLVDNTENLARKVATQITDNVMRGGAV